MSTTWVLDSFARDPWAGTSMMAAGEVACPVEVISQNRRVPCAGGKLGY